MSEILFETRGGILVVTFNRPGKGNALTVTMAKTLSDKLKAIAEDRQIRALVLKGADGIFMDGQEMGIFLGGSNEMQDQIYQKIQFFYAAIRELQVMERPVISMLQGRVSGAGFSFMLASDIVIAANDTIFNTGFIPYAMIPDGGASFFLPRKVGAARAAELLMLSEDFTPEQAEKWGLVNRVVDAARLEAETMALAEKLAAGPTRIIGATKRLLGQAFDQDMKTQISNESVAWTAGAKTFDFREAMKALSEGRSPKFTGS